MASASAGLRAAVPPPPPRPGADLTTNTHSHARRPPPPPPAPTPPHSDHTARAGPLSLDRPSGDGVGARGPGAWRAPKRPHLAGGGAFPPRLGPRARSPAHFDARTGHAKPSTSLTRPAPRHDRGMPRRAEGP